MCWSDQGSNKIVFIVTYLYYCGLVIKGIVTVMYVILSNSEGLFMNQSQTENDACLTYLSGTYTTDSSGMCDCFYCFVLSIFLAVALANHISHTLEHHLSEDPATYIYMHANSSVLIDIYPSLSAS